MSYQVLARKWRPHSFGEMVGQEHVLRALINALDQQRLHHAYLFTGTRGVGKTTVARILAKCLNCETGITSQPCGQCSACREIDEGRFVDLIEVDAASRTGVDDIRELLDNVQYAPARGRFKVYLIDEVHMLSKPAFNALLKPLEEPPEHVKFLLATTDPQKLPVTILSRCLQFALKGLSAERIKGHLQHVLSAESIAYEEDALWQLGKAADGSMRDALSLTDQAIAFGNGRVFADDVRAMLGSLDTEQVYALVQGLQEGDAGRLLAVVVDLAEHAPDWQGVLGEMLELLHRLAIAQVVPDALDNGQGDRDKLLQLARSLPAEDVQFYYQMGLIGRRDLPLAPEPRSGFEMVLLRMLAFRPADQQGPAPTPEPVEATAAPGRDQVARQSVAAPAAAPATAAAGQLEAQPRPQSSNGAANSSAQGSGHRPTPEAAPRTEQPASQLSDALADGPLPEVPDYLNDYPPDEPESAAAAPKPAAPSLPDAQPEPAPQSIPAVPAALGQGVARSTSSPAEPHTDPGLSPDIPPASGPARQWLELFPQLGLAGLVANVASHCTLLEVQGDHWQMLLDEHNRALFSEARGQQIQQAVSQRLGRPVQLGFHIGPLSAETPALARDRQQAARQRQAEQSIAEDPLVQRLIKAFSARVCEHSIKPLDN